MTRHLALGLSLALLAGCAQEPLVPAPFPDLSPSPAAPVAVAATADIDPATGLPTDFPAYKVEATDPTPGLVCLTPNPATGNRASYLLVTDERGTLKHYRRLPNLGFDLHRVHAPDGAARYAYLQVEGPQVAGVWSYSGSVQLLDDDFQDLKALRLLPNRGHEALPADLHAFVYLDDEHYILTAYRAQRVQDVPGREGRGTEVATAVIQEVDHGRVVFEWDSADFPAFYASSVDGNAWADVAPPADYMHMNSVAIDPADGNLVVSFRHQDQVVKLDRQTGAIVWKLGGAGSDFPLSAEQRFSHQHDAQPHADGTLTLFDNGNASGRTRLLTFRLSEGTKAVTDFVAQEPEQRYSGAMGAFQRLADGAAFVGWGDAPGALPDASEWSADGRRTFALTFDDPGLNSYRARKDVRP